MAQVTRGNNRSQFFLHKIFFDQEFSLVRFKGDAARAKKTYENLKPLTAHDIAEIIFWCATRPAHVNINDVVITPTAQANAYVVHRNNS